MHAGPQYWPGIVVSRGELLRSDPDNKKTDTLNKNCKSLKSKTLQLLTSRFVAVQVLLIGRASPSERGLPLPFDPPLEAPMPNIERRPFVEPTLTEEASLAEITLASGDPGIITG